LPLPGRVAPSRDNKLKQLSARHAITLRCQNFAVLL
jgi:hypothetical protein